MRFSFRCIGVSFRVMNSREILWVNIKIVQPKRATRPNGNASDVLASVFTSWNNRLDYITRLKAIMSFLARAMAYGETEFIGATHLSIAISGCLNLQRHSRWLKVNGCATFAHARRINPVSVDHDFSGKG